MSQNVLGYDLVIIHKSEVALTLNKEAYVDMCILDLSKLLIYQFHGEYVKNKYDKNEERLLFTNTGV